LFYKMIHIFTLIKNISFSKELRNSFWLISEKFVHLFIGLIVSILIARYLGPSNFGVLTYSTTIVGLFIVLSSFGSEIVIIKELSDNKKNSGLILGSSLLLRIIISTSLILGFLIFAILFLDFNSLTIVTLLMSILVLFKSFEVFDYIFQINSNSKTPVIIRLVSYLIIITYKIALLIYGANIYFFALSSVFESIIYSIIVFIFFKRNNKLAFSLKYSLFVFKKSLYFFLSSILIFLYTEFDKLIVGFILGSYSLGLYVSQLNLANIWTILPLALIQSFRPLILEKYKVNNYQFIKSLKYLICCIFWIGIIFTLTFSFFGSSINTILYGNDFSSNLNLSPILILSITIAYLGVVRNIWIVAEDLSKYTLYFNLIGSISSLILNILLINFIGLLGVGLSTLIFQSLIQFIIPLFFIKTNQFPKTIIKAILFNFN
jgi:O-antigen/teichoic acid export membrane protein